MTFKEFFKKATGFEPYHYQEQLAKEAAIPQIISVPTGAGKTEAAILAIYLWRRIYSDDNTCQNTPRRLIYCLPMRVLVEQTISRVEKWLANLKLDDEIKIITMMGGNANHDYRLYPEDNAIIIGTQDMLLSRALNRGYAMSPFQWSVEFGLLNNDCLWIMDEVQLMHNGLATSIQLDRFRDQLQTFAPHKTVWMSATINKQWLETVDSDPDQYVSLGLSDKDDKNKALSKRKSAKKTLRELAIQPDSKYTKDDAEMIKSKHKDHTITLVIVNTIKRAQSLFKEMQKIRGTTNVMLIHSRFRRKERSLINKKIQEISDNPQQDLIIISTQVVEAGVDISAKTLITEMAPWISLIQRFGRCNRKGEHDDSVVYLIPLKEKQYPPYDCQIMQASEQILGRHMNKSVSPKDIPQIDDPMTHEIVIRKPDIIGLFDTAPDLSGNYTDVSRFIRSLESTNDVSVFWKDWSGQQPEKYKVQSEEICNVSISDISEFRKKHPVFRYDSLDGTWQKTDRMYPGQTFLLRSKDGGYTETEGWNNTSAESVSVIEPESDDTGASFGESNGSDNLSENTGWITLNDHTVHVIDQTKEIFKKLEHLGDFQDVLLLTAEYHDMGKAHHIFQTTMLRGTDDISNKELWAKRGGRAYHTRKNFRHELASALAFLQLDTKHADKDLIAYLVASHHGKVRMSIRAPPEKNTSRENNSYVNPAGDYILGIPLDIKESVRIFMSNKGEKSKKSKERLLGRDVISEIKIDASIARIGKKDNARSWLQITLGLLEKYGPFKLAYLEAVIRAADSRASKHEREQS